jgi:hypothetical protein
LFFFVVSQISNQVISAKNEKIWADYCGILNSVHYCETVLRDWADQPTFVELTCFEQSKLPHNTTSIELAQKAGS